MKPIYQCTVSDDRGGEYSWTETNEGAARLSCQVEVAGRCRNTTGGFIKRNGNVIAAWRNIDGAAVKTT